MAAMTLTRQLVVIAALTGLAGAQAQVQVPEAPRTWFRFSETYATWQLKTRSDSQLFPAATAPPIQVEETLGVPRHGGITGLQFGRLIGERWRVEVEHTRSRRHGQSTLGADLDVGGSLYLAGTRLSSDIGLTTLGVLGGAALFKDERAEGGLLFGGFWVRSTVRTEGFSGGGVGSTLAYASRSDGGGTTALPLLGAYGSWAWSPDWRLQSRAEFGVGSGSHTKLNATARWQLHRNLGLGLGYNLVKTRVDVTYSFISTTRLQLNYQAHGPALMLELTF
jgi:hypothetical protein